MTNCPVCGSHSSQEIDRDKFRSFEQCGECELIYVPRAALISPTEEHQRYQHHQNLDGDEGYRIYLSEIQKSCSALLKPGMQGLDFGCGATTMLAELFTQRNFPTISYDLYFYPEIQYQNRTYDFIILSEVLEHLREPMTVMRQLSGLLNAGGKIFVKTKFQPRLDQFKNWFYKRDITHVQFFNDKSFTKMADELGLNFDGIIGQDLYVLKTASTGSK